MNRDAPEKSRLRTTNPVPPLKTIPVGPPGTFTTIGTIVPFPWYSVDLSVPLSATHHGVVGPAVMPQPLTRLGSIRSAGTPPSDTRLCTTYVFDAPDARDAPPHTRVIRAATRTSQAIPRRGVRQR